MWLLLWTFYDYRCRYQTKLHAILPPKTKKKKRFWALFMAPFFSKNKKKLNVSHFIWQKIGFQFIAIFQFWFIIVIVDSFCFFFFFNSYKIYDSCWTKSLACELLQPKNRSKQTKFHHENKISIEKYINFTKNFIGYCYSPMVCPLWVEKRASERKTTLQQCLNNAKSVSKKNIGVQMLCVDKMNADIVDCCCYCQFVLLSSSSSPFFFHPSQFIP